MATTRSLSTVTLDSPTHAPGAAPSALPGAGGPRHRLRAVDRDEVVDVADLLPPGATWMPAPQHTLPALPGRPPMVGYLVLVPADRQPPFRPLGGTDPAPGAAPTVRGDRAGTRSSGSMPHGAPRPSTDANST